MSDLAERARTDRLAAEEADRAYERDREPRNIERMMAEEVGRLLGVEIDPKQVRDLGYKDHYYMAELDIAGVTFVGHYLSSQIGLYRTSSPFTVRRRLKRWLGWRTEEREVDRIGDLDGWL